MKTENAPQPLPVGRPASSRTPSARHTRAECYAATRELFAYLLACGACLLLVACSTVGAQKQVACRFAELKESGKLPGFAPNDHGKLQTQSYPIGSQMTYPASMVVYATKQPDSTRYAYTFTKERASSEWRLTGAVRIKPDGQQEDLKVE